MRKRYGMGIVGCGAISRDHAKAAQALGNAEITAVSDSIEEKARSTAEEFGVKKVFADYRQLVDDPEVDVVCICTPSGLHGETAIYAAKAGKHIFCEKPIEITKDKLDAVVTAVRENDVKMGCVFQRRIQPEFIAVKRAVDEGRFGKLILADAYLKYYRSQAYYDSASWRGTWELDGGGALMNQGVHGIDVLQWIAGDVESVFARCAALARKIEVEDTAVAVLKFKNGAFGVIEGTTSVYPAQDTRLEIHGQKGTVIIGDRGIALWQVEDNPEEKAPEMVKENVGMKDDPAKLPSIQHMLLLKDLLEAIDTGREPLIPPEEGRKAVDLILAIYESARTSTEVRVSP